MGGKDTSEKKKAKLASLSCGQPPSRLGPALRPPSQCSLPLPTHQHLFRVLQGHALTIVPPAALGWQGINRDPDGTAAAADDAVGGDSMGSSGAVFPAPRRLQEAPAPAGTAKIQLYTQFVREVPDLQQTEDKTGL